MNRKKKIKVSPRKDDAPNKKKTKYLLNNKHSSEAKVVKSKLKSDKLINKNKNALSASSERKAASPNSAVKNRNNKDTANNKAVSNGNKRGRKPKKGKIPSKQTSAVIQKEKKRPNIDNIPTKRAKGRPRRVSNSFDEKQTSKVDNKMRRSTKSSEKQHNEAIETLQTVAKRRASTSATTSAVTTTTKNTKPKTVNNKKDIARITLRKSSTKSCKSNSTVSSDADNTSSNQSVTATNGKMRQNKATKNVKLSATVKSGNLRKKIATKNFDRKRSTNHRKKMAPSSSNKLNLSKKRGHRLASLNASAKVKLLCQSDRDSNASKTLGFDKQSNSNASVSANVTPQCTFSSCNKNTSPSKSAESKSHSSNANMNKVETQNKTKAKTHGVTGKIKLLNKKKQVMKSKKKVKKHKRNLVDKNIEIIDTRRCKRMASLNASAMMAASYLPETRIIKRESLEVDAKQQPPPPQQYGESETSSISDTIDQVVREWESTVEQRFELSPNSSSNSKNESKCKTTVKTTVKHVKLRGNGTVLESISTKFEQNIMPELSSNKVVKNARSLPKQAPKEIEYRTLSPTIRRQSSSPSAFSPCPSASSYTLGTNSVDSTALLSASPPPVHSSSLDVTNYHSASSSSNSSSHATDSPQHSTQRTNRNKTKRRESSKKSSRSIIHKYKVKTIETTMEVDESDVNQSSAVHNSMLANNVIFANHSSSPFINLQNGAANGSGSISRDNYPALMSYNLLHQQAPFQLLPSASCLARQPPPSSTSSGAPVYAADSAATPLNYINVAPFTAPILHYQPLANALTSLNPSGFSNPVSFPFLQFPNNMPQAFTPNQYGFIGPRTQPSPIPQMYGLSYINPNGIAPHAATSFYQPPLPNSVFNVLPPNTGTLVRPIPYHPQSGPQLSASNLSNPNIPSTVSNFINNSVLSSPSLYGNLASSSQSPSNLFQCSMLRSPSIAPIRTTVQSTPSFSQSSSVLLPNSNSSTNGNATFSKLHHLSAPSQSSSHISSANNSSAKLPLHQIPAVATTICNSYNLYATKQANNFNTSSISQKNAEFDASYSGHIQKLANMSSNLTRTTDEHQTSTTISETLNHNHSINNSTSLTFVKSSSNHKKTPKLIAPKIFGNNNDNYNLGHHNNSATNGKKKTGRSIMARSRLMKNGDLTNRNLENVTDANGLKKSKHSKNFDQNGTSLSSIMSSNNFSTVTSNIEIPANSTTAPAEGELNLTDTDQPPRQTFISTEEHQQQTISSEPAKMTCSEPSIFNNARLLAISSSNNLKKNRRPILHGWSWEGDHIDRYVFINNDDPPILRRCYPAIKHCEGEIIRVRDCVLLKSGPRKTDLPFVAKITALWESPEHEMMMSLLWYYRPEHTTSSASYLSGEIFASKHRDVNSVACIDDKCYVLTYNEYCRFRRHKVRLQQQATRKCDVPSVIVPACSFELPYSRSDRVPASNILPELVFCCRKVFDYRQKRLLKNPNFKMISCE